MPHVDPSQYPVDLPDGAFHIDVDHVDQYRLARTIDEDYLFPILVPSVYNALTIFADTPSCIPTRWEIEFLQELVQDDKHFDDFTIPDE